MGRTAVKYHSILRFTNKHEAGYEKSFFQAAGLQVETGT
jgi:hypothetical protein